MKLTVIGIGPGHPAYITEAARTKLNTAAIVIGVERQLETVRPYLRKHAKEVPYNGRLASLKDAIDSYLTATDAGLLTEGTSTDADVISILASGDPSFYGITEWLRQTYSIAISVEPGISSTQLLFAKAGIPMHDYFMTSLHGRTDALKELLNHSKLCLLTDRTYTPFAIAQYCLNHGENPRIIVGERLSYTDEKITDAPASAIEDRDYQMSVVIVIHER
ncbi:MAG: cobalt-precorrin-7 (C5)-methyltransferase [Clostridiales bacterium]|nr:cobalt-precorrin-7 (C5)-methyltransferase [Clostridiales bacterium]